MEDYAQRLRSIRKKMGFTQEQLAANLGCSTASIISYEHHKAFPPQNVLIKLAELGVDIHWFITGNDRKSKEIHDYAVGPDFVTFQDIYIVFTKVIKSRSHKNASLLAQVLSEFHKDISIENAKMQLRKAVHTSTGGTAQEKKVLQDLIENEITSTECLSILLFKNIIINILVSISEDLHEKYA